MAGSGLVSVHDAGVMIARAIERWLQANVKRWATEQWEETMPGNINRLKPLSDEPRAPV